MFQKRIAHFGAPGTPAAAKPRSRIVRILLWTLATLGVSIVALVVILAWSIIPYFRVLDREHIPEHHPFHSVQAKERYLQYYDARSRDWPVPFTTTKVRTSWGETFVRISGREESRPLLLLPGGGQTSLMWASVVAPLTDHFRVLAIDRPGDFGLSADTYGIRTAEDLSHSLEDLLTALGIREDIDLIGMSYGGWQAAEFAIRHPKRIRSLVLIAPAATMFDFPPDFAWVGLSTLLPGRYFVGRAVRWGLPELAARTDPASRALCEKLIEDASMGFRSFDMRLVAQPRVLTDEELGRIGKPALFMVGERERLYSAEKAIERIHRVAPHIETALVPGVGHDLVWLGADRVSARLTQFLQEAPR